MNLCFLYIYEIILVFYCLPLPKRRIFYFFLHFHSVNVFAYFALDDSFDQSRELITFFGKVVGEFYNIFKKAFFYQRSEEKYKLIIEILK